MTDPTPVVPTTKGEIWLLLQKAFKIATSPAAKTVYLTLLKEVDMTAVNPWEKLLVEAAIGFLEATMPPPPAPPA